MSLELIFLSSLEEGSFFLSQCLSCFSVQCSVVEQVDKYGRDQKQTKVFKSDECSSVWWVGFSLPVILSAYLYRY